MKLRPGTLLVVAMFITIGFSSCVREYICQCTISYSGQAGLPDSTVNKYAVSDTKKKAQSKCEGNSKTFEKDGITAKENCKLY